ncbi:HNH endonuclease [Sphingomonas telluris]|uniref:HNH endonuclease n=1 Tax=Sphingomonas telluris TaxID=2907998 RepID=UPI00344C01CA
MKRNGYGRIQGRAGVALRKARLAKQPLCEDCLAQGRYTEAKTPDHIVPLAQGGTDTDDNIRCLCKPCHDKRTAEQFGYKVRLTYGSDGWPVA